MSSPCFCAAPASTRPIAIALHGGAGALNRGGVPAEKEAAYRAKLKEALLAGYSVLEKGGTSLDAVQTAIVILEDSPLFNAGKGAVYTRAGTHELDASIMDGATLRAGAVAAVRRVKNPIKLARLVMEKTPHVLLAGRGAEQFAQEQGLVLVDPSYFDTPERRASWERARQKREESGTKPRGALDLDDAAAEKYGTVGVVALDRNGNLAAGTSTGGLTDKRLGRIGDSPIIGAGTYANNATCAVSATGQGEFFMRLAVAHDISALMQYKGLSVQAAATEAIAKVTRLGGQGGVIALDRHGRIAMPFNTAAMYRAYIDAAGNPVVKIYGDE